MKNPFRKLIDEMRAIDESIDDIQGSIEIGEGNKE